MNKRIAIVVLHNLSAGEAANIAALLCGQISKNNGEYFNENCVVDADTLSHAAPNFSVVLLKSKSQSQLLKLSQNIVPSVESIVFSRTGQALNNAFAEYQQKIECMTSIDTDIIGVAIHGNDDEVRQLTKKFSIIK